MMQLYSIGNLCQLVQLSPGEVERRLLSAGVEPVEIRNGVRFFDAAALPALGFLTADRSLDMDEARGTLAGEVLRLPAADVEFSQ